MNKKTAFPQPWLSQAMCASFANSKLLTGRLIFNGKSDLVLPPDCQEWQAERLLAHPQSVCSFESTSGPVWIVSPYLKPNDTDATTGATTDTKTGPKSASKLQPDTRLESSDFAKVRDAAGLALLAAEKANVRNLKVNLPSKAADELAFLTGLEISRYRFKGRKAEESLQLLFAGKKPAELTAAERLGWCTNVARHLINLPPNELNPSTFAQMATSLVADLPSVKVEVWNKDRLAKEKMNLLLAVGSASATPPCLLHLRYRPSKKSTPIALVGKGITFDSGGLDLKTSSGMRLMKKDMGGGAAVLGTFLWAAMAEIPQAIDAYIALAENAVGSQAFRPSDVYQSRSGQSVEISNTDAEGRLVLADAMDVAASQSGADEPAVIIDLATLTGAIKVGLGTGLAGLFSNHAPLAEEMSHEFQTAGDPCWVMPLYQKYKSSMNTPFADMINSVEVPFGGAVTAALFLENFAKGKPWAHLDIYAWKDAPDGAWSEAGGSGQGVLGMIHWLENRKVIGRS